MRTESVTFYSEGDELSGLLRLPDDGAPIGGVVHGPGFLGLKDYSRYEEYHERFTEGGLAVLIIDYRGFGDSEGESILLPERQVEDLRNAITYLQTRDEVDADRIGTFGLGGTGGANAVYVAGVDDRVRCAVGMTCIADGAEWLKGMRREYEWLELLDAIEADRERRVRTGESQHVPIRGEDGLQIPTPERQEHTRKVTEVDSKLPQELPLRCAEAIIEYRPIDVVADIDPGALLLVAVEGDDTTPERHAEQLYERAGGPKKLLMLTDTTHYQSYDRYFDPVTAEVVDWYERHLAVESTGIEVREALE